SVAARAVPSRTSIHARLDERIAVLRDAWAGARRGSDRRRTRRSEATMPTVIELLTDDHRAIERLFDAYASSPDSEIALRLGDALVLHACVEEALLYPFVRTIYGAGERLADEAEDDHERVKAFVAEAEDTRGAALDELVSELRIDVGVHMRWE